MAPSTSASSSRFVYVALAVVGGGDGCGGAVGRGVGVVADLHLPARQTIVAVLGGRVALHPPLGVQLEVHQAGRGERVGLASRGVVLDPDRLVVGEREVGVARGRHLGPDQVVVAIAAGALVVAARELEGGGTVARVRIGFRARPAGRH